MFELLTRVLCEPEPVDSPEHAYLFAQTADNQASVFTAGRALLAAGRVQELLLAGTPSLAGYPGFRAWRQALLDQGLAETSLRPVPIDSETLNTLVEAVALVRAAQARSISGLYIVASPFQQLRAFMTTVSVVLRQAPGLRVYNRAGAALPWGETVVHSQGTLRCARSQLIESELERIERYTLKGDLLPENEILEYLQWRDS